MGRRACTYNTARKIFYKDCGCVRITDKRVYGERESLFKILYQIRTDSPIYHIGQIRTTSISQLALASSIVMAANNNDRSLVFTIYNFIKKYYDGERLYLKDYAQYRVEFIKVIRLIIILSSKSSNLLTSLRRVAS